MSMTGNTRAELELVAGTLCHFSLNILILFIFHPKMTSHIDSFLL